MSTTTEVQKINVTEITNIMNGAGEVLSKNEKTTNLAVNAAQQLLDTIEAEGMNDDLDLAVNTWQVKAKQAMSNMNIRRSPITQIMTRMAKMFTELEGKIDPAKPESLYSKLQLQRNAWAKKKADDQKAKEIEILKQQNIAKERISIKADIQTHIRTIYNSKLFAFKQAVQNTYNGLTLDNIEAVKAKISQYGVVYPLDKFRELVPNVSPVYLDKKEVDQIIYDERELLYDELSANFRENMEAEKQNALDLIPSRINELKAIAKAGAEQKAKLEKEAKERKEKADALLKQQAAEQEEKDKAAVAANVQLETATTLFDTAAQLSEIKEENTAKVREGYNIKVLNTAGYGAIFMFWFEKQGLTLSVEEAMKKNGNQMKAFCEKHALKNNEFISSEHLEYEEVFKAVASKG